MLEDQQTQQSQSQPQSQQQQSFSSNSNGSTTSVFKRPHSLYPMLPWSRDARERSSADRADRGETLNLGQAASNGNGNNPPTSPKPFSSAAKTARRQQSQRDARETSREKEKEAGLSVPSARDGTSSGRSSPTMSSIERYSAYLLGEMRKKPAKERALKEALDLQDKVHQLEAEAEAQEAEVNRRRKELSEQILELERRKEQTKLEIDALMAEQEQYRSETRKMIQAVQCQSEFKSKSAIEKLSREIDQLNFHASKVRSVSSLCDAADASTSRCNLVGMGSSGDEEDNLGSASASAAAAMAAAFSFDDCSIVCPVCLVIPEEEIFTCHRCDNMVCGACRDHVSACPSCRKSFKSTPPRRNRLAERLIAARK